MIQFRWNIVSSHMSVLMFFAFFPFSPFYESCNYEWFASEIIIIFVIIWIFDRCLYNVLKWLYKKKGCCYLIYIQHKFAKVT